MVPSPRILHVASHHINVGDGALIQGLRESLSRIAGRRLNFVSRDIVDFRAPDGNMRFDPAELPDYDLLLVGGGGTIDGKPTRKQSGTAFPMSGKDVRRSPIPLAFVAVGYNLFPGEPLYCREALIDLLAACRERGFPFSVRNDGSHERLRAAVGPVADFVDEVPDPGFFVQPCRQAEVPQFTARQPRVLLQLAGDNLPRRLAGAPRNWLDTSARVRRRFLREMADLVVWLVEQQGAEVVLAPHITRDVACLGELLDRIPPRIARPHVRMLGIPHPSHAGTFFQAYAESDLVIGMRGHAVICAVGLGTPCIALSTHAKVAGFMHKCGLDAWSIDGACGVRDALRARCETLLRDPAEYHRRRECGTAAFRDRFDQFMARVWQLGNASAAA